MRNESEGEKGSDSFFIYYEILLIVLLVNNIAIISDLSKRLNYGSLFYRGRRWMEVFAGL